MPNTFLLPLVSEKGRNIGELLVSYSANQIDSVMFNGIDILDLLEYEEGSKYGSPLMNEIWLAADTHDICMRR